MNNFKINPLSANPTKWSNTLTQFVGCLSVFDHFVGLLLEELSQCGCLNDVSMTFVDNIIVNISK